MYIACFSYNFKVVLFPFVGTLFNVGIANILWNYHNWNVLIQLSPIPSGITRVIIGYERHDLGVTLQGRYVNIGKRTQHVFSPLVPGAKYTVVVLGLGGTSTLERSENIARRPFRSKQASMCITKYNFIMLRKSK